jgi:hypothetical protein
MCPPVDEGIVRAATRSLRPGQVLQIDRQTELVTFTRKAPPQFSYVTSIAVALAPIGGEPGDDDVTQTGSRWTNFFCNGINERRVFVETGGGGRSVYTHGTYVRELATDSSNRLYFSEASGAGHDGLIYRFTGNDYSSIAILREIRLSEVGGFWAGNFAFAPDDTLYLSNGNRRGSGLWRCEPDVPPREVFRGTSAIDGFCFVDADTVLYTDWTPAIKLLHLGSAQLETFHASGRRTLQFCDVTWSRLRL